MENGLPFVGPWAPFATPCLVTRVSVRSHLSHSRVTCTSPENQPPTPPETAMIKGAHHWDIPRNQLFGSILRKSFDGTGTNDGFWCRCGGR